MIKIPKKWRELPKEDRLNIPNKHFKIPISKIRKIRKIKSSKQKLIESAKLQYELFGDIHTYLTTWIAGFGSDVVIRNNFGSTQNLLNLFFKKIIYPKNILPSWSDIKRRVIIPHGMNGDLAEEIGIHIGDGNMHIWNDKNNHKSYSFSVSGDLTDEAEYHKNHIKKLLKKLYNINASIIKRPSKNNIDTKIKSKAIVEYKHKILGLPVGNKRDILIPEPIINNRDFSRRCVAGIIDTDFSITSSIAVTGKMASLKLVKQISKILEREGIKHILKTSESHGRFYINKNGAIKIIKEWKINNPKHFTKLQLYEKYRKYIPYSTTIERMKVLRGSMDISHLIRICKKRK